MNKKLFFFFFLSILVHTVPKWSGSHVAKMMRFVTSHKEDFLVFGVPNVQNIWHLAYLAHLLQMLLL